MKRLASRMATLLLLPSLTGTAGHFAQAQVQVQPQGDEVAFPTLEAYPSEIEARLHQRLQTLNATAASSLNMASADIVSLTRRWQTGQTITIAFRGGNKILHKQIADTVTEWTRYANLNFDFGQDSASGEYRQWTTADTTFAADIRVSFDEKGYYSLVGTDSKDPQITSPGEESLNLGRFAISLPADWKTTALHEFGHAIGFEHEHQNINITCDFRFNDDLGYVPTRNSLGQFVNDPTGKRPGLYTVLAGPFNNWSPEKVDFNLRPLPVNNAFEAGPFDRHSIMIYSFNKSMFSSGNQSPCYVDPPNLVISDQDKVGAAKVYPRAPVEVAAVRDRHAKLLERLDKVEALPQSFKAHYNNTLKRMMINH